MLSNHLHINPRNVLIVKYTSTSATLYKNINYNYILNLLLLDIIQ